MYTALFRDDERRGSKSHLDEKAVLVSRYEGAARAAAFESWGEKLPRPQTTGSFQVAAGSKRTPIEVLTSAGWQVAPRVGRYSISAPLRLRPGNSRRLWPSGDPDSQARAAPETGGGVLVIVAWDLWSTLYRGTRAWRRRHPRSRPYSPKPSFRCRI